MSSAVGPVYFFVPLWGVLLRGSVASRCPIPFRWSTESASELIRERMGAAGHECSRSTRCCRPSA